MSLQRKIYERITQQDDALDDRYRCSWVSGDERCRYPGNVSLNTLGGGPWYCRHHVMTSGASDGARIVAESRSRTARDEYYRPARTASADRVKRIHGADIAPPQQTATDREPGCDDPAEWALTEPIQA